MVHKIINNRFRVFVESFLIASIIFIAGFSIGYYVEIARHSEIIDNYENDTINSLDINLQNYYFEIMNESYCEESIKQNLIFADNLYEEGLKLEKYEEVAQVSEDYLKEKKKYVLLKTQLWFNSILLKEKCGNYFDTLVYIYSSDPSDTQKVSQQKIISNVLKELKEKRKNRLILLPISGDLNLGVIDLQKRIYNITYLPSIIINDNFVLEGFNSLEDIERYLTDPEDFKHTKIIYLD